MSSPQRRADMDSNDDRSLPEFCALCIAYLEQSWQALAERPDLGPSEQDERQHQLCALASGPQ